MGHASDEDENASTVHRHNTFNIFTRLLKRVRLDGGLFVDDDDDSTEEHHHSVTLSDDEDDDDDEVTEETTYFNSRNIVAGSNEQTNTDNGDVTLVSDSETETESAPRDSKSEIHKPCYPNFGRKSKRYRGKSSATRRKAAIRDNWKIEEQTKKFLKRKFLRKNKANSAVFQNVDIMKTAMKPKRLKFDKSGFGGILSASDKVPEMAQQHRDVGPSQKAEFVTLDSNIHPECNVTVKGLVCDHGFEYVPNLPHCAQVFCDVNDRVYLVKVKQPKNWQEEVIKPLSEYLDWWSNIYHAATANKKKNDGGHAKTAQRQPEKCPCVSFGYSHGNGSKAPHAISRFSPRVRGLINSFKNNIYVKRYLGHYAKSARVWLPGHTALYNELQNQLLQDISRYDCDIIEDSPFMGTAINIGPHCSTRFHRDSRNLVGGMCAIGVLGNFDPRKSGQLILREPKIILELMPGDLVFIPSSCITHANGDLVGKDTRRSIVQYTAGSLFRYLWDGCELRKTLKITGQLDADGEARFQETWQLFPRLQDVLEAACTGKLPVPDLAVKASMLLRKSTA